MEASRRDRIVRRFLVVSALAFSLSSCGKSSPKPSPAPIWPSSTARNPLILGNAPEFVLLDQAGETFGSDDLAGKAWVADFIFTKCTSVCIPMTATMRKLQADVAANASWKDVKLVSFSVDPDVDRPAVLAAYAKAAAADGARWKFLTGTRHAIWKDRKSTRLNSSH